MIYFAHRGDSSNYPENTMLAFKKAIELEVKGIELDVHKSKDNELVVIHDEDIQRTFLGKGLVKDYTLKELKQFSCRKDVFRDHPDCKIPTLKEVLKLIKPYELTLNIELKTDHIHYAGIEEDVLRMLEDYNLKSRVIISSFYHQSLARVKEIDSNMRTGILFHHPIENVVEYAKNLGAWSLHPYLPLVNEKFIENAHHGDLKVNIYTVNNPEHIRRCALEKVDGIFTDYPGLCKEILS
ncbi:MAG: glycerophosphodiester phosphodiesterase [Peptostreptococcaceae bacterium]|uniref:glycerophosphodiester phosphodiesterase n=1 Tax=Zhenhengia sp. TaxID=2944208 RepID=UPI00290A49BF|nr:glycerophosphodiester phosphodiesterase [Peptostreptococcaceae bacterium]